VYPFFSTTKKTQTHCKIAGSSSISNKNILDPVQPPTATLRVFSRG
jgi:hypothetical protein